MWLGHFTHHQVGPADWRIFALAGKLPGYSNHMNAEQLDALRIAQRVILAGPNATYTADELGLLRRASGRLGRRMLAGREVKPGSRIALYRSRNASYPA